MKGIIWQFKGCDDYGVVISDIVWRNLSSDKAKECEVAFKNNLKFISTNNNEYKYDLEKMIMYVSNCKYTSDKIPIRRKVF
tara:strand:+ start:754 stop:996 length:243 start_codon:yes stop_codon:yes gene_type:complete